MRGERRRQETMFIYVAPGGGAGARTASAAAHPSDGGSGHAAKTCSINGLRHDRMLDSRRA